MTYKTIEELPLHCRLNLPEAALQVYRDAWNHTWNETSDRSAARASAWAAVHGRFERDALSGRWLARAQPLVACMAGLDAEERQAETAELQAASGM